MLKLRFDILKLILGFGIGLGLLFHFELSSLPFGTILTPTEFSPITIFLFSIFLIIIFFSSSIKNFDTLSFVLIILIFYPAIYVFRFGIYDELLLIVIFISFIFSRDFFLNKIKIKQQDLFICLYVLLLSVIGLFYSFKSFRYVMLSFSLFGLFTILNTLKDDFRIQSFKKYFLYCSVVYYMFTIISHVITVFNAPYLALYLHGIGFSPTTWVNMPTLFVIPYISYLYSVREIKFRSLLIILFLSFTVVVLSDSRTGFIPFILLVPFLFKSISYFKIITISIYLIILSSAIGYFQFDNPYWLFDTISNFYSFLDFGGTKAFDYYGVKYDSNVGDTGRYVFALAPFLNFITNPLNILFGFGSYSYYFQNLDIVSDLLTSIGSTLDNPTFAILVSGESSLLALPRPPSLGVLLTEYGLLFFIFVFYRIGKQFFLTKNIFLKLFFIIFMLSLIFIETLESMLFFALISQTNILLSIFNFKEKNTVN